MHIILHITNRLSAILSTVQGWLAALSLATLDYFAGHAFVVFLVVAVTLMDACWGIAVSLRQGRFTLSELGRLTIDKVAVYGCAMFVFVGLDKFVGSNLTASLVGAAIVLIEFWSSCASMLILFPHMPFLRMMEKALKGEIADKLHIRPDEVDHALYGGTAKNDSYEPDESYV